MKWLVDCSEKYGFPAGSDIYSDSEYTDDCYDSDSDSCDSDSEPYADDRTVYPDDQTLYEGCSEGYTDDEEETAKTSSCDS